MRSSWQPPTTRARIVAFKTTQWTLIGMAVSICGASITGWLDAQPLGVNLLAFLAAGGSVFLSLQARAAADRRQRALDGWRASEDDRRVESLERWRAARREAAAAQQEETR